METIEDALQEMRKPKSNCPKDERYEVAYSVADLESILKNFADRIEAAVKREREATCEKSSQVGNAAELREVCQKMIDILMAHGDGRTHCILTWDEFNNAQKMIRAALATPPRNCDIMSLDTARKEWFLKEIMPRLDGDLPLGKEVPFEEWFVSQHEKGKSK